jgi:hypothetical protein
MILLETSFDFRSHYFAAIPISRTKPNAVFFRVPPVRAVSRSQPAWDEADRAVAGFALSGRSQDQVRIQRVNVYLISTRPFTATPQAVEAATAVGVRLPADANTGSAAKAAAGAAKLTPRIPEPTRPVPVTSALVRRTQASLGTPAYVTINPELAVKLV